MNTFSLAIRNLLRNRRGSLATLLAMVVGLVAILLFGGYRSDIMYGTQTIFVQGSGHFQIQRKNYFLDGGDNPTAYGIANYQRIVEVLKADPILAPFINVVTPTLQIGGIAGNFSAGVSRSVLAFGVVPEEHNQMLAWNGNDAASYSHPLPLAGEGENAVVVGTGVARRLKLCSALNVPNCVQEPKTVAVKEGAALPDDIAALSALQQSSSAPSDETRIEMLAATAHGAPNMASLRVVKAENMGVKALDDVYLAMNLSQAQKLIYGTGPAQVTAIKIQLRQTSQMPMAQERLTHLLKTEFNTQELELLDFGQLNPMYGQSMQFFDSVFGFIAVLIFVIVLFTISNTISAEVMKRTVEIGTLRAMGLRQSGIRRLFICEGLVLAIFGAAIGLLLALLIAYLINHSGLTWTPPGYSYAYLQLVRVWQDKPLMVFGVIGVLLVTLVSAWWPSNRASKLMVVDALRHV